MAIIQSGVTTDTLTIDTISKAARITQYTTNGNLINKEYLGSYMVRIEIVPTVLTAGTTYFAMRNLGPNRVFIRRIELKVGFAGTAVASRSLYEMERFSAATPTAGTTLAALKKDNTSGTSSVGDIRFAPGGLTTTGVIFEAPFFLTGHTNQLSIDHEQDLQFSEEEGDKMVLAVNEGFAIKANTAIVLGSYLVGTIMWDERI